MGGRGLLIVVLAVIAATAPSAASASVLVSAPAPFTKACGARIEVGVWYRADGRRSARSVIITITTRSGKRLWSKRVRARSEWRFWHYRPACGRRYVVRYTNAVWGVQRYGVRIRRRA